MKKFLFLSFLILTGAVLPVTAQRFAFGIRGTNLLANQYADEPKVYTSAFRIKPELGTVYFVDQDGFPDYYYRFSEVISYTPATELGWAARLDWYVRYYHKEKWFLHYSAFRRNLGVQIRIKQEYSSTSDFSTVSSSNSQGVIDYNFNRMRTLMAGYYLGKPKLVQIYGLGGLTLAKSGPSDGIGGQVPDKQNPALRGGAGVRYKGVMLEVFLERSLAKMKYNTVNEPGFRTEAVQFSRYTWFDINLSIDLVSIPIKSRKRAREIEEIRNSW